jgi:hypothetical protein
MPHNNNSTTVRAKKKSSAQSCLDALKRRERKRKPGSKSHCINEGVANPNNTVLSL